MALALVQRVDYLLERCRGQRVLHLGCTNWPYTDAPLADGSLLHLRLGEVAKVLHGVDADAEGLARLAARGIKNLHQGDLEALADLALGEEFDVIVAGEIIEHLSNPGRLLQGVKHLMRRDTRLIVTTVNAYCGFRTLQYAVRGRGGVQDPAHPDHVAHYSYATLTHLLKRAGLTVREFSFYDLGTEHRGHAPLYLRVVNDVIVWLAPQLADGLIAECVLDAGSAG